MTENDWWGYFGAFVLGKENLILNEYYIIQIKNFINQSELRTTIKYIIDFHLDEGYKFFYFNILPALFGLYFISIGKVSSFFDWINLIFLLGIFIYLVAIILKNISIFLRDKKFYFVLFQYFY